MATLRRLPAAISFSSVARLSPSARTAISHRLFSATALNMSRVSDRIIHDHRELEDYYNQIINASDRDQQVRYQNQFVWELARHSLAEEIVVYPAMEKNVDGGKEMAQKDREEHQKVKEQLYVFQKLSPEHENFIPTIKQLWADLKQHITEEEGEDLPKLEKAIATDESESLAKSFQRTKKFVPTHSHPSAPDKPPFETAVGLMTAPIDKVLDLFKKFPKD